MILKIVIVVMDDAERGVMALRSGMFSKLSSFNIPGLMMAEGVGRCADTRDTQYAGLFLA